MKGPARRARPGRRAADRPVIERTRFELVADLGDALVLVAHTVTTRRRGWPQGRRNWRRKGRGQEDVAWAGRVMGDAGGKERGK